jgi:hypothetical protein
MADDPLPALNEMRGIIEKMAAEETRPVQRVGYQGVIAALDRLIDVPTPEPEPEPAPPRCAGAGNRPDPRWAAHARRVPPPARRAVTAMVGIRLMGALVALTITGSGAWGQTGSGKTFVSGNLLLDLCNKSVAECRGYVAGIADAMARVQADGGKLGGQRACLPQPVTGKQAMDVTGKFLRAHPERRHEGAAALVAQALSEAWPCR